MKYICSKCHKEYPVESHAWKCSCEGLLMLEYQKNKPDFSQKGQSLWKYIAALPFDANETSWQQVTMGEGMTPIFPLVFGAPKLLVKAEYFGPTLSFKDRGAAVLIAVANKLGVKEVVADSSGNAGTAIAAFGARAGIRSHIYVPEATSEKKIAQIKAHGATVHKVAGTREDTAAAAINKVEESKLFYASHIFNPFFYEGTKTYFYEVYEQMGQQLPDAFIIPVGNGTLLLGAYIAFQEMIAWGLIDRMPRIIAIQAENCSPIAQAFFAGEVEVAVTKTSETLAEGIAIATPARGAAILRAIRETAGDMVTVDEIGISAARKEMAEHGVYVEITSAANYAGYLAYIRKHPECEAQTFVMPLCGAGIKSG